MPTTGDSFDIVGGTDQLAQTIAMLQQELLRLRLAELEKPQLYLDEKTRALAGLQQLGSMTGYVQPQLWQNIIGSMYGQKARGGSPYLMPPPTPPSPEQQKYKIGTEGNVIKTLAQLRQELVSAGGDQKWNTASVEAVLAEYAKVTGYPATPYEEASTVTGNGVPGENAPPPAATPPPTPPTETDMGTPPMPPAETSKYTAAPSNPTTNPYLAAPTAAAKKPAQPDEGMWLGADPPGMAGTESGYVQQGGQNDLWTKMRNAWATGRMPNTAAAWR